MFVFINRKKILPISLNVRSSREKEQEFNSGIFSQKEVNELRGEMRKIIYQSTIGYKKVTKAYTFDSSNPGEGMNEEKYEMNEEEEEMNDEKEEEHNMEHNPENDICDEEMEEEEEEQKRQR